MNKKLALLAGLYAGAAMNAFNHTDFLEYDSPKTKSYSKLPLTKKQKKARAASKRARIARKRNR